MEGQIYSIKVYTSCLLTALFIYQQLACRQDPSVGRLEGKEGRGIVISVHLEPILWCICGFIRYIGVDFRYSGYMDVKLGNCHL